MVTTRSHTDPFPPPSPPKPRSSAPKKWSHTPTPLTLLWLLVSIPLVTWDTFYVMLRPHTMPGGYLHSPIWKPYALYGVVDHVYGWPAFDAKDGFTGAQSSMNVLELVGYLLYLGVVWRKGGREGKGPGVKGRLGERVEGRWGAAAALGGFAISVMTLSKTMLYMFNEFHSGYKSIGHNDASTIFFLWLVPNGSWIVLPTYMVYVFGRDILDGLAIASDSSGGTTRAGVPRKEE